MAPNGQGIKFSFPNTSFVPFFNSFPHVFLGITGVNARESVAIFDCGCAKLLKIAGD